MEILNTSNFDSIINKKGYALVDFSASWCMPCKMLKPILEEKQSSFENVAFYNLDIDDAEEIARRYRIFSVPTLILFKDGEKIDTSIGLISGEELTNFISKNI